MPYDEIEERFSNLPSLDEVERMARLQLQDAQKFGHTEGMRQAQEVLQRIQELKASGALPADRPIGQHLKATFMGKQYTDALTSSYGRRGGGLAGFDPISYMQEFFARGPWPAGTKTLKERELEAALASQALRDALAEAEVTGTYKGQPTLDRLVKEAALTGTYQGQPIWERVVQEAGLTGYYQGKPTWDREYKEKVLAQEAALASLRSAGSGGGTTRLTTTEYETDVKQKVTAGVQAALDELWRQFPEGPSYAAVRDKAQGALNRAKADMVRAGLSKKDIDDMIESLKEYISAVTGVPLDELGFSATTGGRPNLAD
ncbi:MAG: hypothetical protein ACPLQO_06350 [Desulfotomaculales bacterium]